MFDQNIPTSQNILISKNTMEALLVSEKIREEIKVAVKEADDETNYAISANSAALRSRAVYVLGEFIGAVSVLKKAVDAYSETAIVPIAQVRELTFKVHTGQFANDRNAISFIAYINALVSSLCEINRIGIRNNLNSEARALVIAHSVLVNVWQSSGAVLNLIPHRVYLDESKNAVFEFRNELAEVELYEEEQQQQTHPRAQFSLPSQYAMPGLQHGGMGVIPESLSVEGSDQNNDPNKY